MSQTDKTPLNQPSSYMNFLPAVYRQGEVDGQANFLGRFLKIFEKLLTGINDDVRLQLQLPDGSVKERKIVGVEEILNKIHEYFDPLLTPPIPEIDQNISEFVSYLASWVALILDENWDERAKRRLLNRIVPLYKRRGTKEGLTEYLRIFVGDNVSIDEFQKGIIIGETGKVGVDTFVGGLLPHFFIVTITFSDIISIGFVSGTVEATKAILDLEKPAHTYYALRFKFPGIIVGERSTVAHDTIIGSLFPVFV